MSGVSVVVCILCGRGVNCPCSGSARMWEQLCSPGESNSDHKVPRSPSDALSNSPIHPPIALTCKVSCVEIRTAAADGNCPNFRAEYYMHDMWLNIDSYDWSLLQKLFVTQKWTYYE